VPLIDPSSICGNCGGVTPFHGLEVLDRCYSAALRASLRIEELSVSYSSGTVSFFFLQLRELYLITHEQSYKHK
jgi:hypothetical protein